jgi:hypothetical protein
MKDLEICKRIAEIEGVTVRDTGEDLIWTKCPRSALEPKYDDYNPLTDGDLCFQLMVKYDCDLMSPYRPNNDTHWECQIFADDCFDAVSIFNDSPNKAICLAIIEAHKEQ